MTDRRYFDMKTVRRDPPRFQKTTYAYITNFAEQQRVALRFMSLRTALWRYQLAAEGLSLVHIVDEEYEIRPALKQLPAECP